MTPRFIVLALAFALVATVTFASGESDQPAAAAEKEMVLDPSTGEMVTAPEYGGTIRPIVALKPEGIDPYYRYTAGFWIGLVNETLGIGDWTFDRSVFAFDTLYMPDEVLTGHLAESWETPDPLTYVFKLRDDVFWHDKAPVNGRRLTAHDVEYTWQRVLGLSGGEPSADIAGVGDLAKIPFDSITASQRLHRGIQVEPAESCRLEVHARGRTYVRYRPRGGRAIWGHSRLAQCGRDGAL